MYDFPPLPDDNDGIEFWYGQLKKDHAKKMEPVFQENRRFKGWVVDGNDGWKNCVVGLSVTAFGAGALVSGLLAIADPACSVAMGIGIVGGGASGLWHYIKYYGEQM